MKYLPVRLKDTAFPAEPTAQLARSGTVTEGGVPLAVDISVTNVTDGTSRSKAIRLVQRCLYLQSTSSRPR